MIRASLAFLISLNICLSFQTLACEYKRLDGPDSAFSKIPIYDQGHMQTCYAYSAAQLLDFRNYQLLPQNKKNSFRAISPNYLAFMFVSTTNDSLKPDSKRKRESISEGGNIYGILNAAKSSNAPICDENSVKNAIFKILNQENLLNYSNYVHTSFNDSKYFSQLLDLYLNHNDLPAFKRKYSDYFISNNVSVRGDSCIKELSTTKTPDIMNLYNFLNTNNFEKTIFERIQSECAQNKIEMSIPGYAHTQDDPMNGHKMLDEMEEVISEKKPVAIDFCSEFLRNSSSTNQTDPVRNSVLKTTFKSSIIMRTVNDDPKSKEKCGSHASIIIGTKPSKKFPGKCEYLLRNSWGKYSNQVPAYFEKEANGDIWVDQDSLNANLMSITYLNE